MTRGQLWADRGKRVTRHALYHMDDADPIPDLALAIRCFEIAEGTAPEDELAGTAFPGDEGYRCLHDQRLLGGDCGSEP